MFSNAIILLLTLTAMVLDVAIAQHHHQFPLGGYTPVQTEPQSSRSVASAAETTTQKPYFPPAQVHYVNIGEDLAGDYKFGYDTGKSDAGQSFREETRLPDGTVKGAYGYIDADGKQRIVKYTAGIEGFKVESDEEAGGGAGGAAGPSSSQPSSATSRSTPTPTTRTVSQPQPQPQPQIIRTYTPVTLQPQEVPSSSSSASSSSSSATAAAIAQLLQQQQHSSSGGAGADQSPQAITIRTYSPIQQLPATQVQLQSPTTTATSTSSLQQAQPQTITIRSYSPEPQVRPITIRTYQPITTTSEGTTTTTSSGSGTLQLPPIRITSAAQALGGYTPVAHTTNTVQPQILTTLTRPATTTTLITSGGTNQYSTPTTTAAAASQHQPIPPAYETIVPASQIPPTTASIRHITPISTLTTTTSGGVGGTTQARAATPLTLSALLAQHRGIGVSTLPRTIAATATPTTSQLYAGQYIQQQQQQQHPHPGLAAASLGLQPPQPQQPAQEQQEATTWGPPVINKELLSYNIGVQQG